MDDRFTQCYLGEAIMRAEGLSPRLADLKFVSKGWLRVGDYEGLCKSSKCDGVLFSYWTQQEGNLNAYVCQSCRRVSDRNPEQYMGRRGTPIAKWFLVYFCDEVRHCCPVKERDVVASQHIIIASENFLRGDNLEFWNDGQLVGVWPSNEISFTKSYAG
jgi:hypothetical protein